LAGTCASAWRKRCSARRRVQVPLKAVTAFKGGASCANPGPVGPVAPGDRRPSRSTGRHLDPPVLRPAGGVGVRRHRLLGPKAAANTAADGTPSSISARVTVSARWADNSQLSANWRLPLAHQPVVGEAADHQQFVARLPR
jgi:hypothetical protein